MSYVYVYITPVTVTLGQKISILANQPFYVGKGTGSRWKDHTGRKNITNHYQNPLKNGILNHIKLAGQQPIVEIRKDDLTDEESFDLERLLIKEYGRICKQTGTLANITEGGEGATGWKPSEQLKLLWSNQRKGKPSSQKGIKRPGIGGRPKGLKWSDAERFIHMESRSAEGFYDYERNSERCRKISEATKGRTGSAKDKKWFNNGVVETYSKQCPDGFNAGRLPKLQIGKRGLVWYNNSIQNRQFLKDQQPEGFNRGRISKK